MPIDESAGFSEDTAIKQRDFGYVLKTLLTIAQSCMRNEWAHKEFLYFDLNAGPGVVGGHEGSPLIFARIARTLNLPFRAWLFEENAEAATRLAATLAEAWGHEWERRFAVIEGDHNQTVPIVIGHDLRDIRQQAYGLVYADPNGKLDLPLAPMAALADVPKLKRVDQLVNVSATTYKRVRRAGQSDGFLLDDLAKVRKDYRMLRAPVGRWQWTMVLATNWDKAPEFTQIGFRRATSIEGQRLARNLNLSRKEVDALTPQLPFVVSQPIDPTPSISATRDSSPSAPSSSSVVAASASGAARHAPPSRTT